MKQYAIFAVLFAMLIGGVAYAQDEVVFRTEVRGCVFSTWPSGAKWGTEVKAGTPVIVTYGDTVVETTTKTLYPATAGEYYEQLSPGWFEVGVPEGIQTVDVEVGGRTFPGLPTRLDVGPGAHFLVLDTGVVVLDEATLQVEDDYDSPVMVVKDGQLEEAGTEVEPGEAKKWWPWSKDESD